MKSMRTKALQFAPRTREEIKDRDGGCIFCKMWYHMPPKPLYELCILDIMHIVNKSQGGLGVEQNGVCGCRYHHQLLDNGNRGLRKEMLEKIEAYMRTLYPGWEKEELIYHKGV